jgi:hypothetical protein
MTASQWQSKVRGGMHGKTCGLDNRQSAMLRLTSIFQG